MKYFNNTNATPEELKKQFRALCLQLHPDRGGNAEDFREMVAEYEQLTGKASSTKTKTHTDTAEDIRRRQEEARREQEEREERERERREYEAAERARKAREEEAKRKAAEMMAAAVRAWAGRLERVEFGPDNYDRFNDKKKAAAFVATTKRNIKAIINSYFPGLAVKINITSGWYKEKFIISWEDGPNEQQLRDTVRELRYFVPSFYRCAEVGEDYGHWESNDETRAWREAYGQALGDCTDFELSRTLSDEGREQAEQMAAQHFANFDPSSDAPKFSATLKEFADFAKAAGFYEINSLTRIFGSLTNQYDQLCGYWDEITGEVDRRQLRKLMAERVAVNVEKKAKKPEFSPRYGKSLKTLIQLTGVGSQEDGEPVVFWIKGKTLTIAEAIEKMQAGEAVSFGKQHTGSDGQIWHWGKFNGGYKVQAKRAEKFAAAGLYIINPGLCDPNSFVYIKGISDELAAGILADLADIDRQRAEWEAAQNGTSDTTSEQPATEWAEAPADGLTLEEIPGGVAVTGDSRTTYRHRKAIKAHGGKWNKEAQQWQATGDDAARLRAWFMLRNDSPTDDAAAETEPVEPTPSDEKTTDTPTDEKTAEQLKDTTTPADLFDLFEQKIKQTMYTGGDFSKGTPEDMARGYYYNNGRINDLFTAFMLGHESAA